MPLRALLTLLLVFIVCSAVPSAFCAAKPRDCVCCEKMASQPACCTTLQHAGGLMEKSAPAGVDLKLSVTPVLMVTLPVAAIKSPAVRWQQLTPLPGTLRFERLCVRLI